MSNTTTTKKVWRKRALIPIWVVELLVTGIFFILACIVLAWASQPDGYGGVGGYGRSNLSASGAIIISIAGVTILLTLVEIALFASGKLRPTLHLVSAVVKALIWLIYFILIIVASAISGGSALDIILSLAVAVSAIAQVIYGSIIVHRVRKGVFNNNRHAFGDNGHGPVTYEAENGYKMATPMPENPQYR